MKPGYKTTEFVVTLIIIALALIAPHFIGADQTEKIAGGIIAGLAALGYTAARTGAKKAREASRIPEMNLTANRDAANASKAAWDIARLVADSLNNQLSPDLRKKDFIGMLNLSEEEISLVVKHMGKLFTKIKRQAKETFEETKPRPDVTQECAGSTIRGCTRADVHAGDATCQEFVEDGSSDGICRKNPPGKKKTVPDISSICNGSKDGICWREIVETGDTILCKHAGFKENAQTTCSKPITN